MRLPKPPIRLYDSTPDSQWLVVVRGEVVQSYPTRADCEYLIGDLGEGEPVHVSQVRWANERETVKRREPQGMLF